MSHNWVACAETSPCEISSTEPCQSPSLFYVQRPGKNINLAVLSNKLNCLKPEWRFCQEGSTSARIQARSDPGQLVEVGAKRIRGMCRWCSWISSQLQKRLWEQEFQNGPGEPPKECLHEAIHVQKSLGKSLQTNHCGNPANGFHLAPLEKMATPKPSTESAVKRKPNEVQMGVQLHVATQCQM